MKRKPKETRKQRKAREAREAAKSKPTAFKPPPRTLELSDTSYVEEIIKPDAARTLASLELLKDPRINMWLLKLDQHLDIITQGSPISRQQANQILDRVNKWENEHAGKFKSKNEATIGIARMLDEIIATLPKKPGPVIAKEVEAEATVYGEIVEAIQSAKVNFLRMAEKIMLPEGQAAVSTYLYCLTQLSFGARGVIQQDLEDKGMASGVALARRLWADLRNARVFEIEPAVWEHLHRAHERKFMSALAQKEDLPEDQALIYEEALIYLQAEAARQPFPEKLPFDYTYIGFGPGVLLSAELTKLRIRGTTDEDSVMGAYLLGYLVSGPSKWAYELLHVITKTSDYFLPLAQRMNGIWASGETMAPWIVPDMIDLINEHNTVVVNPHEPSPKMRDDARKQKLAAIGYIPQPYYTVRLKHKLIDEDDRERTGETGFTRVLGYRHDRRGHKRCYVQRGPLPIDPKLEEKLLKREYRFIPGQPSAEDAALLANRNFPPKSNKEWMAIKVRWIDDMVVGDESLPYIPAVRVPEKHEST